MGRRANHEGTFETRSDGKVRLKVQIEGKRIVGPWCPTKSKARTGLQSKLANRRQGERESLQSPTVKVIADQILDSHYFNNLSPASQAVLRQALACLKASPLQSTLPAILTTSDLANFRDSISRSYPEEDSRPIAPSSRNRYLKAIFAAFRAAGYQLPSVKPLRETQKIGRILTGPEVEELLNLDMPDRTRLLLRILARTGMRIGEVLALEYENIRGNTIYVVQSLTLRNGSLYIKEPKSDRSTRAIPMSKDLISAVGKGTRFVIHREGHVGVPLWPGNARREISEALQKTKFAGLQPHDLRRTMATLMMEKNIPLHDAMAIMGHDSKMLMEVYSRSNSAGKRKAIKRLFA